MERFAQDSDSHGSLKDLQVLINDHKDLLDEKLSSILKTPIRVDWKSPLKADHFAEYRDDDFLSLLGIDSKLKSPLIGFWPKRGPQWDALGIESDKVFLVEAKAHISEIVTPPTGAGTESKSKIIESLSEVKEFLSINNNIDWSGTFYQYTNRIAHLYYLRVLNEINAFLVNIYFLNDDSVEGFAKSEEEWNAALTIVKLYLGIPKKHKLSKYMIDVFIDKKAII